ncbi:MAG: D-aminoacyl-tRNA deacylase, partial [Candidatus Bipolaricaulota bacterium]
MRIVLQRVSQASVDVDGKRIAEINRGLLLLVGIAVGDSGIDLAKSAKKMVDLRIFEDEKHKM